ncbi:MAG: LPS-assembly protein LptD [Nitrospirae bacterium]|nr:LPS-assembly protein LptD [Nitrospirota bacterium]
MFKIKPLFIIILAIFFLSAKCADCLEEDFKAIVTADSMEQNPSDNSYSFEGNVVIIKDNTTIKADKVIYFIDNSKILAFGNIDYFDKDVNIHGKFAEINVKTKLGVIEDADIMIKKGEFYLSGDKVTRDSEKKYIIENAAFTSCNKNSPDWCFYAKKADVILNDSLKMTDVTFRLSGLTDMSFPKYTVSLKNSESGLLMPKLGYDTSKGFYGSLPYFFAISDNRDATISVEDYSARGIGEALEYRYIEQGGIEGNWKLHHIFDKVYDRDFYTVIAQQQFFGKSGLSSVLNIDYVNDSSYYKEYNEGFDLFTKRYAFSSGDFSYDYGKTRTYLSSEYWIDLKQYDANVYQKIPELGFVVNPVTVGPALFSMSTTVTNFVSFSSSSVNRMTMSPSFSNSFGDSIKFTQNIGMISALYSNTLNKNDNNNLFYSPWYSARANFSLMKSYGDIIHIVEPTLSYNYTMNDNKAAVFDSFELLKKMSTVEFSLINQFIDSKGLFMLFALSTPYDLNNNTTPFSPFKLSAFIDRTINFKADMSLDYYTGDLMSANSQVKIPLNIFDLYVGERFNRVNDIIFLSSGIGFNLIKSLRIETKAWYDIKNNNLDYIEVDTKFSTNCMSISMLVRTVSDKYTIMFEFGLKGLGSFKI